MGCTSSLPHNPSPDARKSPGPLKPSLAQSDSNKSKDGTGRFSTDREASIRSGTSWVKDNLGFKAHLAKVNIFSQLERKYELGTLLGEGITGQVRLCTSKIDKHVYAIKSLNVGKMDDSQVAELRAEIEMLKHLDHPNVVALMEIFESENNICLIMEYCGGGDLSERRFKTEHDLASVVHQLLRAIAHCHHFKIIHRDLKLENIMFTSKNSDDIRLIDFGLSKMFFQQANQQANESNLGISYERLNDKLRVMKTVCGTVCYMAPEVLNRSYTEKADIWAVGVIAFTLITGGPPFNGADDVETLRLVKKGEVNYNEHVWKRLSPSALEFVKALLTYDADTRPSATDALSLPWMVQFRQKRERERPIDTEFARKAWSALLRFTTYPLLKKAAFMVIAFHATEAEKKKLQDIFVYLDSDYVGELKSHHLKRLMNEFAADEDKLTDEQFEEVFNNLDQSRTGGIHHLEFVSATIETVIRVSAKLIDQAFDHLDANTTGFISVDNLYDLLGDRYTMDDAKCIMDQGFESLDLPPEKEVSRTLFFQMMEKCGLPSPFSSGTPSKTPAKPPMKFAEVSDDSLMSSRSLDAGFQDLESKKDFDFKNDFAESKSFSSRDDYQDSGSLKEDFHESKSREDLFGSQTKEEPIEQPQFEASDVSGPLASISE